MTDQPVEYDAEEFWGDLHHLVEPIIGMLRLHLDRDFPIPLNLEYIEQRLALALNLSDLAFGQGKTTRPIDMDTLRDGRADTGCGYFTHDTDEGKAGMQERYTQRLKEKEE